METFPAYLFYTEGTTNPAGTSEALLGAACKGGKLTMTSYIKRKSPTTTPRITT